MPNGVFLVFFRERVRESERERERENIFFLQANISGERENPRGFATPPDFMFCSMVVAEVRYH